MFVISGFVVTMGVGAASVEELAQVCTVAACHAIHQRDLW